MTRQAPKHKVTICKVKPVEYRLLHSGDFFLFEGEVWIKSGTAAVNLRGGSKSFDQICPVEPCPKGTRIEIVVGEEE